MLVLAVEVMGLSVVGKSPALWPLGKTVHPPCIHGRPNNNIDKSLPLDSKSSRSDEKGPATHHDYSRADRYPHPGRRFRSSQTLEVCCTIQDAAPFTYGLEYEFELQH